MATSFDTNHNRAEPSAARATQVLGELGDMLARAVESAPPYEREEYKRRLINYSALSSCVKRWPG